MYEPVIRRATGFGTIDKLAQKRGAIWRHESCDVLVIGAGAAGLCAARELSTTGLSIVLVDDQPIAGGSLTGSKRESEGSMQVSGRTRQ